MSSGRSKFRKATFEVRFISVLYCGVGEIACWCDLLAIEEVSWRLGLTLATCGYIILQSCTIIIDGHEMMKIGGIAVVVVVLAVALGVAGWFWGENVDLISGGTFAATATTTVNSDTVSLALGDVLLFKTPSGDQGGIRFDRMTDDWGADYTSWFIPAGSTAPPQQFQGHVFEKYWKTKGKTSTRVKDIGGNYRIQCGPLTIDWSGSTWLYIPDGYLFAVSTNRTAGPEVDHETLDWHTSYDERDPQPTNVLDSEIAAPSASSRSE